MTVAPARPRRSARAPSRALTPRMVDALRRAADGYDNAEIAAWLGVSEETVKHHLRGAYERLRARNRAHAVAIAMRAGWIE